MSPRYFTDSRYYAALPDPTTLCPAPARPGLDLCCHFTMTIGPDLDISRPCPTQPSLAGGPRYFAAMPNPQWQTNLDLLRPRLLLLVLLLLLLLAARPRSFLASPATATAAVAVAATIAAAVLLLLLLLLLLPMLLLLYCFCY